MTSKKEPNKARVSYRGTLQDDIPYGTNGTVKLVDFKTNVARVSFDKIGYDKDVSPDNIVPTED